MSALTDLAENAVVDSLIRGQAAGFPTTWTIRLYTAAPGETGGGTEATYGGYGPATQAASLANWAGTQGGGTTVASSGTGGQTSNNNALTFGTPATTGTPQTLTHFAFCNGTTPWIVGGLSQSRIINNGDQAPTAAIGALTVTVA
jgi:hypothetical protein